jgi:tetratricopeptide (TPR) repeat protein
MVEVKGQRVFKTMGKLAAGLVLLTWPGLILADGLETARQGLVAQKRGDHAQAVAKFTEAIESGRLGPANLALAHVNRGNSLARLGEVAAAIKDLKQALELAPDHPSGYNSLAWLYATCPLDRYRDGARAVELARTALKLGGMAWRPVHLDTLAAALAEAGRMVKAGEVQKEALKLMKKDETPPGVLAGAEERLKSYRQGRAWRDKEIGSQPPGR